MNAKNTAKLKADFPQLYETRFRGFECGDGWFKLVYNLSKQLVKGRRSNPYRPSFNGPVLQVKEKFGELRFYVGSGGYYPHPLIEEFANKSITVCETCGKAGKIVNLGGLYKTLCPSCSKKLGVEQPKWEPPEDWC